MPVGYPDRQRGRAYSYGLQLKSILLQLLSILTLLAASNSKGLITYSKRSLELDDFQLWKAPMNCLTKQSGASPFSFCVSSCNQNIIRNISCRLINWSMDFLHHCKLNRENLSQRRDWIPLATFIRLGEDTSKRSFTTWYTSQTLSQS